MLPSKVSDNIRRIDTLVQNLGQTVDDVDPLVQNVFANHVVLAGAGLVENSVIAILAEFSLKCGCQPLSSYVERTVGFNNSLNCNKIRQILDRFDNTWWADVKKLTSPASRSAVDSLKTLRDKVAHGKPNDTGFTTVKGYYAEAKIFVQCLNDVVNPE